MLFYMLIMVYIKHQCNRKIFREIILKIKNCFQIFKNKNRLWILKVLQDNNQNFFNLNKKIKLSAVFQNNKDLKQQKWGQNSPRKIVSVLHLWMLNLLSGHQSIPSLEIINGLIRPQLRNKQIKIGNLIVCLKRLPQSM